jgi:hypothetical protein
LGIGALKHLKLEDVIFAQNYFPENLVEKDGQSWCMDVFDQVLF